MLVATGALLGVAAQPVGQCLAWQREREDGVAQPNDRRVGLTTHSRPTVWHVVHTKRIMQDP
jgi:hypothetical protein